MIPRRGREDGRGLVRVGDVLGRLRGPLGQELAALGQAGLAVDVGAQLGVESLDHAEVHGGLLRQVHQVPLLELADLFLLRVELGLDLGELRLEELGGAGGLALAHLQVLLDEEGRQRIGDLGHGLRILAPEAHREGDGAPLTGTVHAAVLELDVRAHALDDFLGRHPLLQVFIEVEARDDPVETGPAEHFLADRLQPRLQSTGDGRADERLGHLLTVDEHERRGAVEARQKRDGADGEAEGQQE